MKTFKFLFLTITSLLCVTSISAQTAEEIIANYMNAIGGKDQIAQITSESIEATMEAMGSQGTLKTTLLNGKGYKQEINIMGATIVMCFNDSMGWQINPMNGMYNAEKMPDAQYLSGKENIYAGGILATDFASKGYTIELVGQETTGMINAFKVKVVSPEKMESFYYFDPANWYLVKMVQMSEMMGQTMEIILTFSDFQKPENGYLMPYSIESNYGGQFFLTSKITKVEINQPVDPAIFAKP